MNSLTRLAFTVLLSSGCMVAVIHADEPLEESDKDVLRLPELVVKTTAHCNFGIGIAVLPDGATGNVKRIFIDEVAPGSTADQSGIRSGDEILSVNGRKVSELKGGLKGGSELFELLVNRPPGERIDVEVSVRVVKRVALTAGPVP